MGLYHSYKQYKSILAILSNSVSDFRITHAARWLERAGYHVEIVSLVEFWRVSAHDLFIVSRPGSQMIPFVETCAAVGKPVIVDMDDDFYSIPPTNPAYNGIGALADNGRYHLKMQKMFRNPRIQFTYASPELARRYDREGCVMLNPWDDENPRWEQTHRDPERVTLGWAGTTTHFHDFKDVALPALKRVLDERPEARVFIGGDMQIYKLFLDYPDERKTYLPGVPYDVYPIMLQMCDVWLAPLADNVFNRAKSDIKLVDALAGRIPWVASALPQYEAWRETHTGTLVGEGYPGLWYEALKDMIDYPRAREDMVKNAAGLRAGRSATAYGKRWVELVEGIIGSCK